MKDNSQLEVEVEVEVDADLEPDTESTKINDEQILLGTDVSPILTNIEDLPGKYTRTYIIRK